MIIQNYVSPFTCTYIVAVIEVENVFPNVTRLIKFHRLFDSFVLEVYE